MKKVQNGLCFKIRRRHFFEPCFFCLYAVFQFWTALGCREQKKIIQNQRVKNKCVKNNCVENNRVENKGVENKRVWDEENRWIKLNKTLQMKVKQR